MKTFAYSGRFVMVLVAACALGTSACSHRQQGQISGNDCPQEEADVRSGDAVLSIALAGRIVDRREYHDCQRFLKHGTDDFGVRAGIWAAEGLAGAFDRVASDSFVPVAEIHLAGGNYEPLRLEAGLNCLYLARQLRASDTVWRARMTNLGNQDSLCLRTVARDRATEDTLTVRRFELPDTLTAADVPPVARWDRTTKGEKNKDLYYIGIRCETRWCEVGPFPDRPDHNPPVDQIAGHQLRAELLPIGPNIPPMTNQEAGRIRDVQGWHDVQELAARGGKKSSKVLGAAFPQPELQRINLETSFDSTWVPAAYVYLNKKYSGNPLTLPAGFTTFELCRGTVERCKVSKYECKSSVSPADSTQWWARIAPKNGEPFYRCVRRHAHRSPSGLSGVIPAGAVRWAWSDNDESLWIRCADGCCTID